MSSGSTPPCLSLHWHTFKRHHILCAVCGVGSQRRAVQAYMFSWLLKAHVCVQGTFRILSLSVSRTPAKTGYMDKNCCMCRNTHQQQNSALMHHHVCFARSGYRRQHLSRRDVLDLGVDAFIMCALQEQDTWTRTTACVGPRISNTIRMTYVLGSL